METGARSNYSRVFFTLRFNPTFQLQEHGKNQDCWGHLVVLNPWLKAHHLSGIRFKHEALSSYLLPFILCVSECSVILTKGTCSQGKLGKILIWYCYELACKRLQCSNISVTIYNNAPFVGSAFSLTAVPATAVGQARASPHVISSLSATKGSRKGSLSPNRGWPTG